jgi:type II secretory pathway component GspD/PulD (secretin)
MRRMFVVVTASLMMSGALSAQERADPVIIRLFPLQYISNSSAAKLIAPFVPQYPSHGVFEAGSAVRGITVRSSKDVIDRVDSLLKANDRAPVTVVLRFQLIAALDSAVTDQTIPADVQTSLRDLFRFGGYRLLAQGSTAVSKSPYEVTMAHDDERYSISGGVEDIRVRAASPGARSDGNASVELHVRLTGTFDTRGPFGAATRNTQSLLSTGLTVPIGQTVVLGSAAGSDGRRALILTVRPEILK